MDGPKSGAEREKMLRKELERCLPLLIEHENPEKIILFGSLSRGQVRQWSDLDLVIVKKTELSFLERIRQVLLLLRPRVGMDILVYTPEEFERLLSERAFVREEILKKGEILYERYH